MVTPLVSLMEDQLAALHALRINAAKLNASSTKEEVNEVQNVSVENIGFISTALTLNYTMHSYFKAMIDKNSALKLLYVTPEKLAKSKRFMSKLQKMFQQNKLARIAIDEVHCCSQWGHDFRPGERTLTYTKRILSQ